MNDFSFEEVYKEALLLETCPDKYKNYERDVFETMRHWQRTYIVGGPALTPYKGEYLDANVPLEVPESIIEALGNIKYLELSLQYFEIKYQYGIWVQYLFSKKNLNLPASISILTFFYLTSYIAYRERRISEGKEDAKRKALENQMEAYLTPDPSYARELEAIRTRYVLGRDGHGDVIDFEPIKDLLNDWHGSMISTLSVVPTKVSDALHLISSSFMTLEPAKERFVDPNVFSSEGKFCEPLLKRLSQIDSLSGPFDTSEFKRQSLNDQILILMSELYVISSTWEKVTGLGKGLLRGGVFLDMVQRYHPETFTQLYSVTLSKLIELNDPA